MKKILLYSMLSIIILGGLGCKKTDKDVVVDESQKDIIVQTTVQQQAFLFCKRQGYTTEIAYTEKTGQEIYCLLPDGLRCLATDFLHGICDTKKDDATSNGVETISQPTTQKTVQHIPTGPRYCSTIAEPVCGMDNITYTNACLASKNNVLVQYTGSCTAPKKAPPVQQTTRTSKKQTTQTQTSSGSITQTTPSAPRTFVKTTPSWFHTITALLAQESHTIPATMTQCYSGDDIFYIQNDACLTCFSVLYNIDGETVCFPNNDIHNSCPEAFSQGKKPDNCRVIWRQ